MRGLSILLVLVLCGCASVERTPAGSPVVSPGGLNEDEQRACEGYECKYFIAPCSMKEHSPLYRSPAAVGPEPYMSLKEESYLRELENLAARGYCQMPPRAMPAELYNRDTCIYVFIKQPECGGR